MPPPSSQARLTPQGYRRARCFPAPQVSPSRAGNPPPRQSLTSACRLQGISPSSAAAGAACMGAWGRISARRAPPHRPLPQGMLRIPMWARRPPSRLWPPCCQGACCGVCPDPLRTAFRRRWGECVCSARRTACPRCARGACWAWRPWHCRPRIRRRCGRHGLCIRKSPGPEYP